MMGPLNQIMITQVHDKIITRDNLENIDIIYVLKGCIEIESDGLKNEMESGHFMIFSSSQEYKIKSHTAEILYALFQIDQLLLFRLTRIKKPLFILPTELNEEQHKAFLEKFDQLLNEIQSNRINYLLTIHLESELLMMLMEYLYIEKETKGNELNSSNIDNRTKEIQYYIQQNFRESISLDEISEYLNLTPGYLSKYIKKHYGMTFTKYLRTFRLKHAYDELIHTKKSILSIALDNGFSYPAAFSQAFKNEWGENPLSYRSTYQNDENILREVKKDNGATINHYLKDRENHIAKESNVGETLTLSEQDSKVTLKQNWCNIMNGGSLSVMLKSETQQQLALLTDHLNVEYIRLWDILSWDVFCKGRELNVQELFGQLDHVIEFIEGNNFKPYLNLGFLTRSFKQNHYTIENNVDYDKFSGELFSTFMNQLTIHLVNMYGVSKLDTWYFEIDFPIKKDMEVSSDELTWYVNIYTVIYKALKNISKEISVGGGGFESPDSEDTVTVLLGKLSEIPQKLDFVSLSSFPYQRSKDHTKEVSLENNYIETYIKRMKRLFKDYDYMPETFHLTEWGNTTRLDNPLNDHVFKGAFVLKNLMDMADELDCIAYWVGLDITRNNREPFSMVTGNVGLLTNDGIKKPGYYALQFLNHVHPFLIGKTKNGMLTTNHKEEYTVIIHNYKHLNDLYTLSKEENIRINRISSFLVNQDPLLITVHIPNVKNGRYRLVFRTVNEESGSVQDEWKRMGFDMQLHPNEVSYFKRIVTPRMTVENIIVTNNDLLFETRLRANEIKHIQITFQYE